MRLGRRRVAAPLLLSAAPSCTLRTLCPLRELGRAGRDDVARRMSRAIESE